MKKGARWGVIVLVMILAAGLAVLLVRNSRAEQRRDAAVQRMLEQARPIERELEALRQELDQREAAVDDTPRTPCFMIGYQITQHSDIELAARQAERYDFTPVFVLDPTSDAAMELLDALRDVPGEIVLSVSPCTSSGIAATALREALSEPDRSAADTGFFLLRNDDDTPEAIAAIAKAGYTGCIRHADADENTVLDSGLVTLSYSQIKSGDFSVESRLEKATEAGQALLFVFELDALRTGALTETDIDNALQLIRAAWTAQGGAPATVAEAETAVRARAEAQSMSRAAFETFAAEQNEKIAALEAELDAIYAQWNKEDAQ